MAKRVFEGLLKKHWSKGKFVCVGLDSDFNELPLFIKKISSTSQAVLSFNKAIVDATADLVCCFKPQSSFYEAMGKDGWIALKRTVEYINKRYPDIPTILDAKRGDIISTNKAYVKAIFDELNFDAVTVNPYLGGEPLEPFFQRKEKGIIVLTKTSNPGAGEIQDLKVDRSKKPLYIHIAKLIKKSWNKNGNLGVVVGATYPKELRQVRAIVGDIPILIPGIGSQGGEAVPLVKAGKDSNGQGMIINSSRSIIFASKDRDFDKVAREKTLSLHMTIKGLI